MTLVRIVVSKPRYLIGALLLLLFVVLAVFGHVIYPNGTPINPGDIYAPPSLADPLGTDFAGRNVLAMVVLGTRSVLEVAALAGLFTITIGVVVGVATGYIGGVLDTVFMRITDFFLALPSYPVFIILAVLLRVDGAIPFALLLSILPWAGLARAVRSQILATKKQDYIEAAHSLEIGRWRVAVGELLPSLMPYIVMHLILAVTGAVYAEVGLYFLGVVPIKNDNWGVMLNWAFNVSGAIYSPSSVFFLIAPLLAITLLQMGAVFFNKALEEYFNPNLRRSAA
jgi:peptide/nickel transport system permease protein